jgi:large subunit ribosomal protein L21
MHCVREHPDVESRPGPCPTISEEQMYAIIRAGGKQAKVREGDVIDVERIRDAGDEVTYRPLLVVGEDGDVISEPSVLEKAKVIATVLGESRGEKIDVFKYKNKSGYRRRSGHRQTYSRIQVTKIDTGAEKKAAAKKTTAEKTTAKKTTAKKSAKPKAAVSEQPPAAAEAAVAETAADDAAQED